MMTKKAVEKLDEREKAAAIKTLNPRAMFPEMAMLSHRTDDEDGFSSEVEAHLGKFKNRFAVFGKFDEQDRAVYMERFRKHLDLNAAMGGITRKQLLAEPEAVAIVHAMATMSKDGFTTKELSTQRVVTPGGIIREGPGLLGRIKGRLFGQSMPPTEAPPEGT
jgi:hypothetical protein